MGNLTDWYGARSSWTLPFRRDAKRYYGDVVRSELHAGYLLYRHEGLDIPGRPEPVPVTVRFDAQPRYETYGLRAEDYPRVYADPGLPSPHRMPDDSLCLFYPGDPPGRRWTADNGLLKLLSLTADHIFFETYWRDTGGHDRGIWLGLEAPHGYQGPTP